jgi:hypothetical protein
MSAGENHMSEKEIQLGNTVRDKVSGLIGIASSRVEHLNGCVQIAVRPKVTSDNKMPDAWYIDIETLEYVDDGITVGQRPGGGETTRVSSARQGHR